MGKLNEDEERKRRRNAREEVGRVLGGAIANDGTSLAGLVLEVE